MPRLDTLAEVVRKNLVFFPCHEHDTAPWAPIRKPLSESKVALVTTAGVHLREDRPFGSTNKVRDTSFRVIPSNAHARDIVQSHSSIGFDRTAFYRDINISFPIDRLRELRQQGVVGGLSDNFYSFMGAQRDPTAIIEESGPEVARQLLAQGTDTVLLTPT